MTRIPTVGTTPSDQPFGAANTLNDLDLDSFFQLMITELQTQDPLNPLENDELLAQISQIREVGATERLTETLDSVLLGQNIASATNLIGAQVEGLSDDREQVSGVVSRVTIDKGVPKLFLQLNATAEAAEAVDGNVEEGEYRYVAVWRDENTGQLLGVELNGGDAVKTTGTPQVDQAVRVTNLPSSAGPKQIYRTDKSGGGALHLVTTLTNGSAGSFVDTFSDDDLSELTLIEPFQHVPAYREFTASLNNITDIRPPDG